MLGVCQHHGSSVVVSTVMVISNLGKMNEQFLLCSVCGVLFYYCSLE